MSHRRAHAAALDQRMPAPADFPVAWANPDDADRPWQRDPAVTELLAKLERFGLCGHSPGLDSHMKRRFESTR